MKRINRICAAFLGLSLVLSGCGKNIPKAPELIEPVSANEAFRPVEYGDIGLNKKSSGVVMGVVVPKSYCHIWTTSVNVQEMCVNIGDYVSAGDVLAIADIATAEKNVKDLKAQLDNMTATRRVNESMYELTKSRMEYEKQALELNNDNAAAALKSAEIEILKENNRYEGILYEHRVSDLNKEIAAQQEIVSDGTLRARTGGYVVYCKELSGGRSVFPNENVVVIADYDDCYIEINDVKALDLKDLSELKPEEYESCYTISGKEKKNLVEYAYTEQEKIVAENKKSYPPLRLLYADGTKPENVGEVVPVFFIKNGRENVLRIGRDSVFSDAEGDYVYVKTDKEKEKRYVRLGDSDANYIEVVDGLAEGELVFYSTEDLMPVSYEEYKVEFSDYIEEKKAEIYSIKDYNTYSFYSEVEGQVTDVAYKSGETVNAGDYICTVKTDNGSAMITELKLSIDGERDSYNRTIAEIENQIRDIDGQIYLLDNPPEEEGSIVATSTDATATDASGETFVNPYKREMLLIDRQLAEYRKELAGINYDYRMAALNENYEKLVKGNDGNGNISIRAEKTGKLTNVYASKGANISAGSQIFNIQTAAKPVVRFSSDSVSLGRRVTFTTKDNGVYYGTIISAGAGKNYVTTIGDKVYITNNVEKNGSMCSVSMDDEAFYDLPISDKTEVRYVVKNIPDSVVVPKSMVYREKTMSNEDKFYVWKIASGELVKTYVLLADANTSSANYCIIDGVTEGDVLARELTETEKQDKTGE